MLARIVEKAQSEWRNKHHNFTQRIDRLYDVWNPDVSDAGARVEGLRATVSALQSLIEGAITDGVRLRAIGSGWSISDVAATDGRAVNTKPLNWLFGVSESSVSTRYAGRKEDLVFAQCGASVAQLNEHLVGKRRSLKTQGASNGQTIVGAFSTGSHGSALSREAIQDHVVGLHLIVGPARHVWLERASYPVASTPFVERLGAELVRDDTLFDAALVSFGSFGVIHAVMIETEPLFLLEAHRMRRPLDDGLRRAIGTLDFSALALPDSAAPPHHFDAVVNPYNTAGGAFFTVMYKRPYRSDYPRLEGSHWGTRPGDDFLHVVGTLSDEVPALIPRLVNEVMNTRYRAFSSRWGTLGEIFSYNTIHGRASTGSALGVPLHRAQEALDLVLSITEQDGPFAGVYGLRYVKGSKALLGFTRFDTTCVIDLDGVDSRRTRTFFQRVWHAFEEAGIPHTFHWGKAGAFDSDRIRRMYGTAVDDWLAARHTLLDAASRAAFSSPFLERSGLDADLGGGPPV